MKSTKLSVKTSQQSLSPEQRAQLEARAARFQGMGISVGSSSSTVSTNKPSAIVTNPADAEKLAKRAQRFADVQSVPTIAKTGTVSTNAVMRTTLSSAETEKLAKRAARFANVPIEKTTKSNEKK